MDEATAKAISEANADVRAVFGAVENREMDLAMEVIQRSEQSWLVVRALLGFVAAVDAIAPNVAREVRTALTTDPPV